MNDLKKLNDFLTDRWAFSQKTFGTIQQRDCMGPLRHLEKEVKELIEKPHDHLEWADCFLLLLDAAKRKGHSLEDLVDFASQKLAINKARNWVKQEDGTYRHAPNDCPYCGGEGGVDSGGITPWGAPIFIPCPSCSQKNL